MLFIACLSQALLLSSSAGIEALLHGTADKVTGGELSSSLKNLKVSNIDT